MIEITCYGKTETWPSREAAISFYKEGMLACIGSSEGERYARIYSQLLAGKAKCSDREA